MTASSAKDRPRRRPRDSLSSSSSKPKRSRATAYSPPILRAEVGRVVGAEREPHTGFVKRPQRMRPRSSGRRRATTFEVGQTSSTMPRSASSPRAPGPRSRARRARCGVTGSVERAADRLRPGVLARVARAAEPGRRARSRRRARTAGREAGLVAGQVEADDVRVAVLGVAAGDLLRAPRRRSCGPRRSGSGASMPVASRASSIPGRSRRSVGVGRPTAAAWSGEAISST